ncbi:MAG: DUF6470 family protein [Oscillospiraceae bacterium]
MEQLLSIKTIPVNLQFKITHASMEISQPMPKVNISRQDGGGFVMESEPIQVQLNTYNCRKSLGLKNNTDLSKDFANKSVQVAYEATAKIAREGTALSDAFGDGNTNIIPQLAYERFSKSIDTVMSFLPKEGPDISWKGGTLNISYNVDKLDFDWDTMNTNLQFIPGNIEFSVDTMPKVIIEYTGGPIYVPKSADPNYMPIDAKA